MHQTRQARPITTVRPRRLLHLGFVVLAVIPACALLAFRRDLTVEIGVPFWFALSTVLFGLLAAAMVRLLNPEFLMRITPQGIEIPGLIRDAINWNEISKVEALTKRGDTGDVHDRLVFHLKRPRVVDFTSSTLRRRLTGAPQAAIALDVGVSWPYRADELRRIIRDTAATYARSRDDISESTQRSKSVRIAIRAGAVLLAITLPIAAYFSDTGLPRMFSQGLKLYKDGKIAEALPLLESDARAGEREAAHALGMLYLNGDGVERNPAMAAGWFHRASANGHANAALNLGNAYRLGLGVPKNVNEAVRWYEVSADRGAPEAAFALSRMYRLGDGIRRDYQAARQWLEIAAAENFAPAEHDLGQLYRDGLGAPRNPTKAIEWFLRAANRGHIPARYDLARILLDGDSISRETGRQHLVSAADAGYAPAQRRLAALLFSGAGDAPDIVEAYKWISLAERTWPAATRADLVREKARITNAMSPDMLTNGKLLLRNWRPSKP